MSRRCTTSASGHRRWARSAMIQAGRTYSAIVMAGLDGIQNKIHPGDAADKNLYDLPPEEAKEIPQVCGSLKEALEELDKGRAFLTKGGVFSDDFIDAYIALKSEEEIKVRTFVHPLEYELYYSC